MDDGIASMSDALNVLSYYEQIGIREVWLTPHIIEDIPNTTQTLRHRYDELRNEYHGCIKLHLAAENMVDDLFLERLEANDVLPIGEKAYHLLIEFSYMQAPTQLYSIITKIFEHGYTPLLAHPERYSYMSVDELETLKQRGCKLQMNITSLTGAYGTHARDKAETMLSQGLYDVWGSDLHSLSHFKQATASKCLKQETLKAISSIIHHRL